MSDAPVRDRLREIRARAGWSVRDFARALGYEERFSSYSSYETKFKKAALPLDLVKKMVPLLRDRGEPPITASEVWALGGVTAGMSGIRDNIERAERVEAAKTGTPGTVVISEYDVSPQAGGGSLVYEEAGDGEGHAAIASWSIPKPFLESYLPDTSGLAVVRVIGNSMEPDFLPSERVLVDTNHRTLSHDGVYVLWNGVGVVIKQLQLVPRSDPPRVRIISVNPTYPADEVELSEIAINGRVVGKWVWK